MFSRKKFLQLITGSFWTLLLSSPEWLNSCTWNKKEDPGPADDLSEPSLSLRMDENLVYASTNCEIKWQQTGLTRLNLYFSKNNGSHWDPIKTNVEANLGQYSWIVPPMPSTNCLLKITNAENELLNSKSASTFRIAVITEIDLALYPSLQTVGGFEIIDLAYNMVIVIRESATDFKILSMYCTHNGCIINYNGSPGFNCSCHGSEFNAEGQVTQGPAQRDLPRFEYEYNAVTDKLKVTI